MNGLIIDSEKCIGCGVCADSCASNAITVAEGRAVVNENCTLCGICRQSCPVDAITIERKQELTDNSKFSGVWVYIENTDDTVSMAARELIAKGRELSDKRGCELTVVTFFDKNERFLKEIVAFGADKVVYYTQSGVNYPDAGALCTLLCEIVRERKPEIFLFPATSFGRELAPRMAVSLRTGLTADCTGLDIDPENGLLIQTRPTFGGNLMATIVCPDRRPQMATVRPGVFKVGEQYENRMGEYIDITPEEALKPIVEVLEIMAKDDGGSIKNASKLVVLGRGIGSKKNLKLFEEFAGLIGAEIGCSRPLVESGFLEYRHQVGQTGSSVAPKLLISIGVSGAIQHLAGIGNAEKIIAINSDPEAPIFSVSDIKIVGDCVEIVNEIIRQMS